MKRAYNMHNNTMLPSDALLSSQHSVSNFFNLFDMVYHAFYEKFAVVFKNTSAISSTAPVMELLLV